MSFIGDCIRRGLGVKKAKKSFREREEAVVARKARKEKASKRSALQIPGEWPFNSHSGMPPWM